MFGKLFQSTLSRRSSRLLCTCTQHVKQQRDWSSFRSKAFWGVTVAFASLQLTNNYVHNSPEEKEDTSSSNNSSNSSSIEEDVDHEFIANYTPQKVNPIVYLDINMEGIPTGRIYIRLFTDVNPITSEIFRTLCGKDQSYAGVKFHRIVPTFMQQTGLVKSVPVSVKDIFLPNHHEATTLSFDRPYLVAMAKSNDRSSSRTQFFITTSETPWLNGEYVVVGKVIHGTSIVKMIDDLGNDNLLGSPNAKVTITSTGQVIPESRMQTIRDAMPYMNTDDAEKASSRRPGKQEREKKGRDGKEGKEGRRQLTTPQSLPTEDSESKEA